MPETDLKLERLRNIGIIAHIDAGKTTLSERILFYTHKIHRLGEVHEGAATMDFMPEEQERGITIASACTTCAWEGHGINLIDTPGHVDFTIEVERSLRVLDGVVGVFCAVAGVEPQSETVWAQAEKFGIPKLAFINKLDRPGASFTGVLEGMRLRLKANPVPIVVPAGEGDEFGVLLDVLHKERLEFDQNSKGMEYSRFPFGPEDDALAGPWREKLIEAAADEDDAIMEQYLAGVEPEPQVLRTALRKAVLNGRIVPVFAGSALRNTGIQPLLDGICAYLPSPLDAALPPALASVDIKNPDAPLAALVFKVLLEAGHSLALIRIYSGAISEGMACLNATRGDKERLGRIYRLHADRREQLERAGAGEIVAVQGLKKARTGDTLSSPAHPVVLENISAYQPVISIALEPRNASEGVKLDEAMTRFALEDPTLKVEQDENSGQRIVSGMGELHLEVLCERLKREYGVEARSGKPQVLCLETVQATASATAEFDRELGDIRHYGRVTVEVSPAPRGSGNSVRVVLAENIAANYEAGKSWPRAWVEEAEKGIADSLYCGVLKCFPVRDVEIRLSALGYKAGASSPAGYHMAASTALKEAMAAASPALLEPVMRLEISVPEANLGAVMTLLNMRSGKVEDLRDQGGLKLVTALAPMRELFGFSTALRSATQGRANPSMKFDHFGII